MSNPTDLIGSPQYPQRAYGPGAEPKKATIFDVNFTRFLSLTIIKIWWVVALISIALGTVVAIIDGAISIFKDDGTRGFATVILAIPVGLLLVVLTRIFLEAIAVLFRIADNTSAMAARRAGIEPAEL